MEILFLLLLTGIWLIIASISDLKKREVPNWLSFSLIIFALVFHLFYSILNFDALPFIFSLTGFALFFILAYAFYYARIFAGGDAKLLMGLGAVLPSSSFLYENLIILAKYIFLLLLIGGIYGLAYSLILVALNRKRFIKEFSRQMRREKGLIFLALIPAFLSFVFVFYSGESIFFLFPLIIIAFPFLLIYARAVERYMVKSVSAGKLTVGDWLYQKVRVGRKLIKPYWEGLSEEEVKLLRKSKKKIKIKQGIPFVPSFFLAFLLFLLLRYSSWGFLKLF
jgi:Flp pilus assembly protein protease CpaA